MKRVAAVVCCMIMAAPLIAQNANAPVDDKIDSPLEYYFGALAVFALFVTWAWLWLRTRESMQRPPEFEPAPDTPAPEEDKS